MVSGNDNNKIIVLAAHPDDEVLGCGGTVARLAAEGYSIVPVIVCENATVRYGESMKAQLEQWAFECAQILGVQPPEFLGLPDQQLDKFSALEMAQIIEEVIKKHQPQTIFTHHGGDINKDHRVIYEATMVATRPLPDMCVKTVYTYETISATEWGSSEYFMKFMPNTFYDITDTLSIKIKAFSRYKSEIRQFPHPRSLKGIEIRALDWGARVGLNAAEAFQLVRKMV
jgi:LmbE family N-acetylglucosaminyl deacetylase